MSQALPPGYELDEYVIENEIGSGGFGITYKAHDKQLDRYVAIKEYFPFNLATRGDDLSVSPKTAVGADIDEYGWGLSRFIQEARSLALFEHPNIIRVIRYIERNSTAYIIMEFADGRDVSDIVKEKRELSVAEVKGIVLPIASGLISVHSADVLHRDIKPGNIRVRENGTVVLIDFGAARQAIGVRSQSISTILTPGYAPIEQYSSRGNQGPWTDMYALAAVGYVCLTRENLRNHEATIRIRNDSLPKLVDRIQDPDRSFLAALDWALSPEEEDRPQSAQEWLDAIEQGMSDVQVSVDAPPPADATIKVSADSKLGRQQREVLRTRKSGVESTGSPGKKRQKGKRPALLFGIIGVVLTLCVAGTFMYMAREIEPEPVPVVIDPPVSPKEKGEIAPEPVEDPPAVITEKIKPEEKPADGGTSPYNKQDDADFALATQINTAEAFKIYLRLHPDGRHRDEALAKI